MWCGLLTQENDLSIITTLTPEQEARFPHYVERWTAIGLTCGPINRERHNEALADVYKLAGFDAPRVIYTPCPLSGALAAGIYTGLEKGDDNWRERSAIDSAIAC